MMVNFEFIDACKSVSVSTLLVVLKENPDIGCPLIEAFDGLPSTPSTVTLFNGGTLPA